MEQRTVRKAYKYRLKPSPEEEWKLGRVLDLCRDLYYAALEQRVMAYLRRQVSLSRYEQEAELKSIRADFPEYATIHSSVLQDALARLDKTYQAFFRRIERGEKTGFSRFTPAARYTSFSYKEFGNGTHLNNGFLVVSKVGRIAVRWSHPLEGAPKTVTVSREADGWYRQAQCALKAAQRWVSRRNTGSNRRRNAVMLLAKAHQKVRRQRKDFHQKTALALVHANDVISHEDVQTANMVRNRHLAKSIQDVGWAAFLTILSFQAVYAGRSVIGAPPASASQICSGCGVMVQKGVSVRWHRRPEYGTSLHRDHNAAKKQRTGRAGPSGRRGVGRVGEPSVRRALVPSERQREMIDSYTSCLGQSRRLCHERRAAILHGTHAETGWNPDAESE
jgi:putative transposase